MTEPIGYNDDQFDDLPNEDRSWEKMSRLLDEDKKRRRVIPFWLRFSALAILLLGSGIAGWIMLSGDDGSATEQYIGKGSQDKKTGEVATITTRDRESLHENNNDETSDKISKEEDAEDAGKVGKNNLNMGKVPLDGHSNNIAPNPKQSGTVPSIGKQTIEPPVVISNKRNVQMKQSPVTSGTVASRLNKANSKNIPSVVKPKAGTTRKKDNAVPNAGNIQTTGADPADKKTDVSQLPVNDATPVIVKPNVPAVIKPVAPTDQTSVIADSPAKRPEVIQPDTARQKEAVATSKEKTKRKKPLQWSLGFAFQQPLALGSQGMSDYNYNGKRSFIADHLPGIFVTAAREKWFATAEFNYGVPQAVEQLYFSQASKYDASNLTLNVERFSVEKVYYHQFSAGGNYLLFPKLSAGLGGSYNLLTGAVTQRELRSNNVITGDAQTQTSLAPVKGYKDSFLFKSTAATFLQTEYHWNRVRLGVRYTYALQPYMRYTKPEGTIEDVRNNTLQLLVRFQLWKK